MFPFLPSELLTRWGLGLIIEEKGGTTLVLPPKGDYTEKFDIISSWAVVRETMPKRIWIKPEILFWEYRSPSGSYLDEAPWRRAYRIWEHAAKKLQPRADEMDRTDAITTLKRCLNQRLKQLEKAYKLNTFLESKNTRYLQLLEQLGLVRPLLLRQLMEVRNAIEHDDKAPPKIERCLEMLDVVWYFLKTTDGVMQVRTESILLQPTQESPYWVEIDIGIKRIWKINARGWLPEDYILMIMAPNHIGIHVDKLHTNKLWKKRGEHLDKKDTDLYFSGRVTEIPHRLSFARLYFSAY